MSPEQEQLLVDKVNDIHNALVGPLGIEENGIIYKVNNHDTRIRSLEFWRWFVLGIAALAAFLAKLWAAVLSGK